MVNAATTAKTTCKALTFMNFFVSSFVSKIVHETIPAGLTSDIPSNASFDFIVVGSGSAGSVIASRLSENPNWRVLLLEAGCNHVLFEKSPNFYWPEIDQRCVSNYWTVPNSNVNRGRPLLLPSGVTLGGTSSINGMFYTRGNRRDYDNWAAMGNIGWDYNSVLPYFKKAEHMTNPQLAKSEYHSTGGPLGVSTYDYRDDVVTSSVKKAFEDTLDLPDVDYNGEEQVGSSFVQFTIRDGERDSTNTAYLKPVLRYRKNLVVKTYSLVVRIIINPSTRSAIGVEYVNKKIKKSVFASKEVIVCAGAIRSPQLLMLSGIGPRDHLESLGIDVIQDLPVGENLRDHVSIFPTFPLLIDVSRAQKSYSSKIPPVSSEPFRPSQIVTAFKSFRSGDFFWPDVQYSVSKLLDFDGCVKKSSNSIFNIVFMFPSLLHPKSFGNVRLRNTNPFSKPKVDPRYLSHREDVEVLMDALKYLLHLNDSKPLKDAGLRFEGVPRSSCCPAGKNCTGSDAFWECIVRTNSWSTFHPYGSCKMGPQSDPEAVVDPELRVKGISNLRVVDASVLPTISGNINAPIIMFAEKISEVIKTDWT